MVLKKGEELDLGAELPCITKCIIGQQTILPEPVLVQETLGWHQDTALLISVENETSAVSLWLPVGGSLHPLVSYTNNNPLFLLSLF